MAKQKRQRLVLFGAFLILISVLLFIAMISYFNHWQEDFSSLENFKNPSVESANVLKKIGAYISHFLVYQLFGLGAFIFSYLILNTGVTYFLNWKKIKLLKQWSWGLLNVLWLSISMGFFYELNPILSGVVGYEVFLWLKAYMGSLGLISLLLFALLCFLVIELDWTPERIKGWFFSNASSGVSEKQGKSTEVTLNQEDEHLLNELKGEDISLNTTSKIEPSAPPPSEAINTDQVSMEVETPEEEAQAIAKDLIEKQGHFDPTLVLSKYQFPSLNLLKDYGNGSITINQEELELNKNKIVDTLNNYKIGIAHIKATIGPTVTLYEIVPNAGIRISKIKNLEDDIALSLSALGIRIIAPIPGKGTIGIEVPNQKPSIVSMRSVLSANKFQKAEMELPLALGKTISNETFVVDLTKMPHLLMAGATGQGKSVGLNAVISSLLYKKHPAEVKFVLVDPKKVELNIYNKIERHYLAKLPDSEDAIITDNSKVINTLNSLCIEMDNRYELLKNALCRNVKEYNKKFEARKLNPNEGHNFLPYIVLIIDEFADLIMTAGKEVETPIARLAQLARAVGIHLIIATQRPSVNVITGIIKANFPARIAFRVTSKIDSRTILDNGGAEQLIGRGDMLYTQGNDLTRLQCAFVDTPEVERIAAFIGAQTGFAEAHLLPEYVGEENESILDIDASERDSLFKEAAEVIVVAQQGSASLLQRKLKLGYNRAGRIIDQMEAAGIVGPFEGSKARQVLIPDLSSLERFLNNES